MKKKIEYLVKVSIAMLIFQNELFCQKNKLLSVKIEYEYFLTESIEKINCNDFYGAFNKSLKYKVFRQNEHLTKFSFLRRKFVQKDENLDVRGVITFNYKNYIVKYCFDRYGSFYRNGKTYSNKDLLNYIEENIKLW